MTNWQSLGNGFMVLGVIGLVGWIGYENVRVQENRAFNNERNQMDQPGLNSPEAAPATHELLMIEKQVPDAPDLMATPASQLRVQFSPSEWDRVKERAEQSNVPVKRYVRDKLLDTSPARS